MTNGKVIRLLVDDEPLDVRYGHLEQHDRTLDLRAGTLSRNVEWRSPAGDSIRVRSTRLVSLTQRAVAAIEYEVQAVDASLRIVLQSELVANEELPSQSKDPRAAAILENPLVSEEHRRRYDGPAAAPHPQQRPAHRGGHAAHHRGAPTTSIRR